MDRTATSALLQALSSDKDRKTKIAYSRSVPVEGENLEIIRFEFMLLDDGNIQPISRVQTIGMVHTTNRIGEKIWQVETEKLKLFIELIQLKS